MTINVFMYILHFPKLSSFSNYAPCRAYYLHLKRCVLGVILYTQIYILINYYLLIELLVLKIIS